jgi:hypothetical protein
LRSQAHGAAARGLDEREQLVPAIHPDLGLERRRRQLRQRAPLPQRDAARLAPQHLRAVIERVHQPPRVEQVLGLGQGRLLIKRQRDPDRARVAGPILPAQQAKVAPGPADQIGARRGTEERRPPSRDGDLLARHRVDVLARASERHARQREVRVGLARRPVPALHLLHHAAVQSIERHQEMRHRLVVAGRFAALEQALHQRAVMVAIAAVVDVGQQRAPRERPRIALQPLGPERQPLLAVEAQQLVEKPLVPALEELVEQQARTRRRSHLCRRI